MMGGMTASFLDSLPAPTLIHQRFNPLRPPDWRLIRVQEMVRKEPYPGRCTKHDDEWVRKARTFFLRYRNPKHRHRLYDEFPGIWLALDFSKRANSTDLALLEARILAGQDDETIAAKMGWTAEAVRCYEAIWWNVRDRLSAPDYILKSVIWAGQENASDADWSNRVAALRGIGYFGGPEVLDALLEEYSRASRADLERVGGLDEWLDINFIRSLKRKSMLTSSLMQVNRYNAIPLLQAHVALIQSQREDDDSDARRNPLSQNVAAALEVVQDVLGDPDRDHRQLRQLSESVEPRAGEMLRLASGGSVDGLEGCLERLASIPATFEGSKEEGSD